MSHEVVNAVVDLTRAEFCWLVGHWGGRGGTHLTQRTALVLWQGMVHTSDPNQPGARAPGLGADHRRYTAHRIPCAPPAANGDFPACSLEAEVRVRISTARVPNNRLAPRIAPVGSFAVSRFIGAGEFWCVVIQLVAGAPWLFSLSDISQLSRGGCAGVAVVAR